MAVHTYEVLFLLDPNKSSADWDGSLRHCNGIIEKAGGEIIDSRPWGEPKLAYPIGKFRKGTYLLAYFRSDPNAIAEMERQCRLSELIIRHLFLKLHPHVAEGILAHLSGAEVEPAAVE